MPLTSDNAYAQAMRAPRVVLPPLSVHTLTAFKRAEAAGRQAAKSAGFARRTEAGVNPEERFRMQQDKRPSMPRPEADTGRLLNGTA